MDDFNVTSLHESKNEWGTRLLSILTPLINEGFVSIFDEALALCKTNNEMDKQLMTFQNFISRIPKWNSTIIETERKRICEKSGCKYLEDLITCVHIIHLKLLTAVRAGTKQKKIDIKIPDLDTFIHKVYIHVARKVYVNVYLFEKNIAPLQIQKNHRELEIIIQECILNAIRDSIPIEEILRAYMDETIEDDVIEEIKEEVIEEPDIVTTNDTQLNVNSNTTSEISNTESNNSSTLETNSLSTALSFNDLDSSIDVNNKEENILAPKDINTLEQVSMIRNEQRKLETDDDDDDEPLDKLKISNDPISLDSLDIHNIEPKKIETIPDLLLDDIEVL
jgi:hypothetical protein